MAANKKRQRVFVCIFVGLNKTDRSEVQRTVFCGWSWEKKHHLRSLLHRVRQPRSAKTLGRYSTKAVLQIGRLVSLVGGCWILMVRRLFVCCEAMFNPVMWKIEPVFFPSFHGGFNQPVLMNQGCSCPALCFQPRALRWDNKQNLFQFWYPFFWKLVGTNYIKPSCLIWRRRSCPRAIMVKPPRVLR